MPNTVTISLDTIPNELFSVSVNEYASRIASRRCPDPQPDWVVDLVDEGIELPLKSLIMQAGLHFSRRLNPNIFEGSSGKRQRATALAWALISMIKPYVDGDQLWVEDPQDQDIKRLCSEILGVGAAIQILIQCGIIDGRTVKKISNRFDYEAKSSADRRTVYIEAKGTFNGVSIDKHRASFFEKLTVPGIITASNPRGYGRAIGIVFSTWSQNCAKRKADVELLDPEFESRDSFEEMVRDVIRYYATVLDEAVGKQQGAVELMRVSRADDLFLKSAPPPIQISGSRTLPILFHSATLRLVGANGSRTFMGSFWESRAMVTPPLSKAFNVKDLPIGYVGIDRDVWTSLEGRDFERLLSLHNGEEHFLELTAENMRGLFYVDRYGVLRAWLSEVPDAIDLHVEGRI